MAEMVTIPKAEYVRLKALAEEELVAAQVAPVLNALRQQLPGHNIAVMF